ncbi:MAG TPA: hypothetical protein VN316_02135 [candidate division Zixibacteria bacterium]|nr:hypothetical protein [candidate division Zixibacteria bacterium]
MIAPALSAALISGRAGLLARDAWFDDWPEILLLLLVTRYMSKTAIDHMRSSIPPRVKKIECASYL